MGEKLAATIQFIQRYKKNVNYMENPMQNYKSKRNFEKKKKKKDIFKPLS